MNGAKSLVQTLLAAGVGTCFANPGTSEMHFVAALDQVPGMKCVLGLQENVVTGMADGYYRLARKPACTLLHCAPGLANGMGNLHNARRARSGIVNIVGDQATHHRPHDAPLTGDTTGMAQTVSAWVHTSTRTADLGRDAVQAVRAASTHPGQIATLILPADVSWQEGGVVGVPISAPPPPAIDGGAIDGAARILRNHPEPAAQRPQQIEIGARAHAGCVGEQQRRAFPPLQGEDAPARHRHEHFVGLHFGGFRHASSMCAASACHPSQTSSSKVKSSWSQRVRLGRITRTRLPPASATS